MRLPLLAVLVAATTLAARPVDAGRTPFGWVEDVEVLPERGAEIQTWIAELNQWHLEHSGEQISATLVSWAAVIGATDRIEVRLPIDWGWYEDGGTRLERWGAEARWRLADPDPLEAPVVVPLVRLRTARLVSDRGTYRVEPGAVASADFGPVRLTADLGVAFDLRVAGGVTVVFRPGLGVSAALTDDLRAGAEVFAELGDTHEVSTWLAAGPSVAYTHGRTWLSGAVLVGLMHVDWAPRLNWGIGF